MSEHNDPLKENQEEMSRRSESSDEQMKQQVNALLTRLQRIRRSHIPVPEYN